MQYLLHLTLFATDPMDFDCVTEAGQVADFLGALADVDPDAVRTVTGFDRPSACLTRIATPTLAFRDGDDALFSAGREIPIPTGVHNVDGEPKTSFRYVEVGSELHAATADGGALTLGVVLEGAGLGPASLAETEPWFGAGFDVDWSGTVPSAAGLFVLTPASHLVLVGELVMVEGEGSTDEEIRAMQVRDLALVQPYADLGARARQRAAERLLGLR